MTRKAYFILILIVFGSCHKVFSVLLFDDLVRIAEDEAAKAGPAAMHMAGKGAKLGSEFTEMVNLAKEGLKEIKTVAGFSVSSTSTSVSYGLLMDLAYEFFDYQKKRLKSLEISQSMDTACYFDLGTATILDRSGYYPYAESTCPDNNSECLENVEAVEKFLPYVYTSKYLTDSLQNKLLNDYIVVQEQEKKYSTNAYSALLALHVFLMDYENYEQTFDTFFQVIMGSAEQMQNMYLGMHDFHAMKMNYCLSAHHYVTLSKEI